MSGNGWLVDVGGFGAYPAFQASQAAARLGGGSLGSHGRDTHTHSSGWMILGDSEGLCEARS